jgi:hypothetical protein
VHAAHIGRANLGKLAVLSGVAMLGLALATPARADDQSPPPPLMLGKSALVAPDEPDATVVDTETPSSADVAAPPADPAPVRVVAVRGWELAAKPHHYRAVTRPAETPATPAPVISRRAAVAQPVRAWHVRKTVSHRRSTAPSRWYQVPERQYRPTRASGLGGDSNAVAPAAQSGALHLAAPRPAGPRSQRTICELRARKCLQLCDSDASYTVSRNERWIRVCIAAPYAFSGLDRLHAILLQRIVSVARIAQRTGLAQQYQCMWAQYQSNQHRTCRESSQEPALSPPRTSARVALHAQAPVIHAVADRPGRALAAVVTRERRAGHAVVRAANRAATEGSLGTPEVARSSASSSSTDDWLLRSLVALVGVAMLAILLALVGEAPRAGASFAGARSRLVSKGLSTSRIDLGDASRSLRRRSGGIAYRD